MPLSNVTIDRVDGKKIVRFGIHAADLAAMKRTMTVESLITEYLDDDDIQPTLEEFIRAFEAGDKRRVAIEDGKIGPVTKTKPVIKDK